MSNILLIDDDTEVLKINESYLAQEGFTVRTANHPSAALDLVRSFRPDWANAPTARPLFTVSRFES